MTSALELDSDTPLKLKIVGMDCGNCALTIEDSIRKLPGVAEASVRFATESMEVRGNISRGVIERRLKELGYKVTTPGESHAGTLPGQRGARGFVYFVWEQPPLRRALLTAIAVCLGPLVLPGGRGPGGTGSHRAGNRFRRPADEPAGRHHRLVLSRPGHANHRLPLRPGYQHPGHGGTLVGTPGRPRHSGACPAA